MSEWREFEFGEIAEIQTGPFGSQLVKDEYIDGGIPVITVENIKDFQIESFTYPSVTRDKSTELSRYFIQEGDVLFSRVGSVDLSALVKKDQDGWIISSRMLRARLNDFGNARFVAYFLQQSRVRRYINAIAVGATMPSINTSILKSIPIRLPQLETQIAIAEVLSSLDDKINLLKRQNKTLEGMAEALFRQWFIVLEKENVETWKKLSQVTVKITDGTHSTVRDDPDGSFFLLSAKNIKDGQVVTGNSERRISEETLNSLRKRTQTQKGDVLLTTVGTIGESTVLHEAPNFELQRSVAIIRVNKVDITPNFLFQFMQTRLFMHEVDSRVEGSVQKCLFLNAIGDIEVPIPTNKKLEAFDSSIGLFRSKITNNQRSIVRLEAKRDTLLPKLMSGEVRVQMD